MTFIGVSSDGSRVRLDLKSAALSPRTLRTDATGARIALVSTTALLLGGDHVQITIDVGPGCWLEIVDTAGTVAYDGQGAESSWAVHIRVGHRASLRWNGEPFVVAHGASVVRSMTVDLLGSGAACLRETLILGRAGECGGSLLSSTRVARHGRPLLAEELDLRDPVGRQRPGILGSHRIVDTVSLLGRDSSAALQNTRVFRLAGHGAVARFLGSDLHRSGAPAAFARWRSSIRESDARVGSQ